MLNTGYNFTHHMAATLPYASPEVVKGLKYNQKTDIWALGCLLYEMIAGKPAYDSHSEEGLKSRIISYPVP